ncbi:MAG: DeoR family transcriptional regulator [Oscillospiraceae bacterium]|nr:DeoR family transcriptional regulator [Oscillospiraceae bacterium]
MIKEKTSKQGQEAKCISVTTVRRDIRQIQQKGSIVKR